MKVFENEYSNTVFNKIFIIIAGFLSTIIINRYLGPSLKGQYAYLLNLCNIFNVILNLGVGQSYPFFRKKNLHNVKKLFNTLFIVQLIIYITFIIPLTLIFGAKDITIILLLSILMSYNLNISFVLMLENIKLRNRINMYSNIVYLLILCFIILIVPQNINFIIAAYAFKYLFDSSLIFLFTNMNKNINFKIISMDFILKISKTSIYSMLLLLMTTLNYSIDLIILKYYCNYDVVGIYSVGVSLGSMLWIIPDAFKEVLFGKFTKDNSNVEIKLAIKINVYICLVVIFGFLLLGKQFIRIVYGSSFISAYVITLLLFIGTIPMIFYKLINTLFITNGKQKLSFFILLISVITNIGINIIIIPILGALGAALSSIISYTLCGSIFLILFLKDYNISMKELFKFSSKEREIMNKIFMGVRK